FSTSPAPTDVFSLTLRRPQISTLFPYTTLFRSRDADRRGRGFSPRRLHPRQPGARTKRRGEPQAAQGAGGERARRAHAPRASCADRKSTRLNSSHVAISYAVFCLKKKVVLLHEG